MDSKLFTLQNRDYRLDEDGTLSVFVVSKNDWMIVPVKTVTVNGTQYYRYSLYNPKYDWTEDNKKSMERYEAKLAKFNNRQPYIETTGPAGAIISRSIADIIAPPIPRLAGKYEWKRFYMSHGSLVLQYWYGVDVTGKMISYVDNVPDNKFHVANWMCEDFSKVDTLGGGRKKLSDGVVNTILANAGAYSSDYIAKALGISSSLVTRVILGRAGYDKIGDRKAYAMNIRSSRGAFYGIVCYHWESVYDFINRVLVMWSNDYRYQEYCNVATKGMRKTKGRMGYGDWEIKYGRDERVSKALVNRWIEMNAELIGDKDDVEELCKYVDNWVLGSDRCWGIEKYLKYTITNKARMPEKVRVMKGVPCTLRTVGVQSSHKTLYDLTDWQLINLFDYCAGDFQSLPISMLYNFVEEDLENEPDWTKYEENGYESADEFWASYVSLLGGQSVGDFRTAYGDMLRSIPYTNEVS